ncbi:MAG: hypothetical protein MUC66_09225 [Methanolinea sp.]|nr:hypothetical protein [Methanolinea sp.]
MIVCWSSKGDKARWSSWGHSPNFGGDAGSSSGPEARCCGGDAGVVRRG